MIGHSPAAVRRPAVHWAATGTVAKGPAPAGKPARRRRFRRDEEACDAARSAARIPLIALTVPTLLALVVARIPDLVSDFYLSRLMSQLEPLVVDSLVSRSVSAPDTAGDLWVLVLVAGACLLTACTSARWRPDAVLLWSIGGLVTAGFVVLAAQGLWEDPWGHALGTVLALRAAAAATVTAAAAVRSTEPPWVGTAHLRWTPWLVGYFVTVLPVLVVGRTIDPPGDGVSDPVSLAAAASAPLSVAQFLNGAWLGLAGWALLQIVVQPRWRRAGAGLLVLAVALGPLRDLAHVDPAGLTSWWSG